MEAVKADGREQCTAGARWGSAITFASRERIAIGRGVRAGGDREATEIEREPGSKMMGSGEKT